MKRIKLLSLFIVSISLLPACSGGNANTGNKDVTSSATEPAASSSGDAQFSYKIDGQFVSGGAIDPMQEFNTAFTGDVDEGKELMFYLTDAKSDEPAYKAPHSMRFSVPYKTGKSSFGHEENGWGIDVNILSDNGRHTTTYNSDSFTINITSLSATRVSGTFSGKFTLHSPDGSKQEVEVTDGKFDIPFSTGNMRPT